MLEFLYGSTSTCLEKFNQLGTIKKQFKFIDSVNIYGLDYLSSECEKQLISILSTLNCYEIYKCTSYGQNLKFINIANHCANFILSNFSTIILNPEFSQLFNSNEPNSTSIKLIDLNITFLIKHFLSTFETKLINRL